MPTILAYGTPDRALQDDDVLLGDVDGTVKIPVGMLNEALLLAVASSLPALINPILPAAIIAAGALTKTALQATAKATEAIVAGAFVNIYSSGSVLCVRNAIATDLSTAASGFVLSSYVTGQAAVVSMIGINTAITVSSSAIPGVWLSDTVPGGFTTTQPTASGHIVQALGQAIPGLGIFFAINPAYAQ